MQPNSPTGRAGWGQRVDSGGFLDTICTRVCRCPTTRPLAAGLAPRSALSQADLPSYFLFLMRGKVVQKSGRNVSVGVLNSGSDPPSFLTCQENRLFPGRSLGLDRWSLKQTGRSPPSLPAEASSLTPGLIQGLFSSERPSPCLIPRRTLLLEFVSCRELFSPPGSSAWVGAVSFSYSIASAPGSAPWVLVLQVNKYLLRTYSAL